MLVNLLTNAARHSPEALVIRVNAVLEDLHLAVSVADERLHALFRKFSGAQSGEPGGDTGLGSGRLQGQRIIM